MSSIMPDPPAAIAFSEREQVRHRAERYVYVIEFSSGIVKVGQSGRPQARVREHEKAAAMHGHTILRRWVSAPHTGCDANEKLLIAFAAERWPASSGREAFTDAHYDEIVEFAAGLQYERLSEAELDARLAHAASVGVAWEKAAKHRRTNWAEAAQHRQDALGMEELTEQVKLIASLANDENRWAACDAMYDALKKVVALDGAPWAAEDPTAAERYLVARGCPLGRATEKAAEFELNFRALFALEYGREAHSFEEIARFCDRTTSDPTQLDLGGAA
ncbi:hypothetical protein [Streptomyces sp. NPDC058373]|uniref:hypothetical protein n=1 Tax=Streptomyces sp. NPDC058373 TaxID=3346465 RepID=UPI003666E7CE